MLNRYASAMGTGTLITLALLFVMQLLISLEPITIDDDRTRFEIKFLPEIKETPPQPMDEKFIKERMTESVTTPPRPSQGTDLHDVGVTVTTSAPPTTTAMPDFSVFQDGPLVSIVRVAPVYPQRAIAKGLEGHVILRFDVLPDGSVTNISLVETSNRIFVNAAIGAAERFKFKPRVVDGQALISYGMQNLFRFNLDDI